MSKPVVAIIGRANVGKSTLFNRLLGGRIAIVEDLPGTTRDRIFADVVWGDEEFILVDTGGLEVRPGSAMGRKIKEQVELAIAEADVILLMVDVPEGLTAGDWDIAEMLRGTVKPVVLVANKVDNLRRESQVAEFHRLGVGAPLAISAYHGRGVAELMDEVLSQLPTTSPLLAELEVMKVAIVGRPNVGKSMLLNAILGEERAIVDEVPGTTRDALDTLFHHDGKSVLVIDTAGIRRRGRIGAGVEYYSVIRALRAIERAGVVFLVIDAAEGVTLQDLHVAGYIKETFKRMVLVANKWDLVPQGEVQRLVAGIQQRLRFMPYVPILCVSAKSRHNIEGLLPQAEAIWQEGQKHLTRAQLSDFLEKAIAGHNPPRVGTKKLRMLSLIQKETNPPTFIFYVNEPHVHFSYQRYLENKLREVFGFTGTPLRLIFKKARLHSKKEEIMSSSPNGGNLVTTALTN